MLVSICCDDVASALYLCINDIREHRNVTKEQLVLESHRLFGFRWSLRFLLKLLFESLPISTRMNGQGSGGRHPFFLVRLCSRWCFRWLFYFIVVR